MKQYTFKDLLIETGSMIAFVMATAFFSVVIYFGAGLFEFPLGIVQSITLAALLVIGTDTGTILNNILRKR
jgi:hypothetical protein